MKIIILIFISILTASPVYAEIITLKSGKVVEGKIIQRSDQLIKVDQGVGVNLTYYLDEVKKIDGQKSETQQIPESASGFNAFSGGDLSSQGKQVMEVVEYLKKDKFQDANNLLKKWENDNPADQEMISFYKKLTAELAQETNVEKRQQLLLLRSLQHTKEQIVGAVGEMKSYSQSTDKLAPISAMGTLLEAINKNDLLALRDQLDQGFDINSQVMGINVLIYASEKGKKDAVALLFERGAKIDAQDDLIGRTALIAAVQAKHLDVVKFLVEKGADVNIATKTNETALNLANKSGHFEMMEVLTKAGAIANKEIKKMWVQKAPYSSGGINENLNEAVTKGDIEKVKEFVLKGANVNAEGFMGFTPLMSASDAGQWEIVEFLLTKGAKVNKETDNSFKLSAIGLACNKSHYDTVNVLLNNGANVNQKGMLNNAVLMIASQNGDLKIATLLIDKGANVNDFDDARETALMKSVRSEKVEIAKLLVSRGAKLSMRNFNDATALDIAKETGNQEIIQVLVDALNQ